jgi:hypothetical protein
MAVPAAAGKGLHAVEALVAPQAPCVASIQCTGGRGICVVAAETMRGLLRIAEEERALAALTAGRGMAPQATEALTHGAEGAARRLRASSLIAHALSFVTQLHACRALVRWTLTLLLRSAAAIQTSSRQSSLRTLSVRPNANSQQ